MKLKYNRDVIEKNCSAPFSNTAEKGQCPVIKPDAVLDWLLQQRTI